MKFEGYDGYTGKLAEEEILPRLSDEWKKENGYFDFDRSIEWVTQHQKWNPSDPSNPESEKSHVANDLHYHVAEAMGLDTVDELKLYSALGSPLDQFYGVDAYFEYNGARLTVDFTLNKNKKEYKADIVINPEDLENKVVMEHIIKEIAEYLKRNSETDAPRRIAA